MQLKTIPSSTLPEVSCIDSLLSQRENILQCSEILGSGHIPTSPKTSSHPHPSRHSHPVQKQEKHDRTCLLCTGNNRSSVLSVEWSTLPLDSFSIKASYHIDTLASAKVRSTWQNSVSMELKTTQAYGRDLGFSSRKGKGKKN